MHRIFAFLLFLLLSAQPAFAYICTISPKGDAVLVKTGNPYAQTTTCTVTCRFVVPDGIATITCSQTVPGGAKDWFICIRPTEGKAFGKLEGGSEQCAKP